MCKTNEPTPSPSLEKGGEQIAPEARSHPKKKYRIGPKTKKARRLRNDATGAEKLLWTKLNRKQLDGYKFRRQHPIGRYVLDFYCVELKLCIEVDGDQHGREKYQRIDQYRTQYLQQHGIAVLRVWNCDVFENVDGIMQLIADEIRGRAFELGVLKNK